MLNTSIHKRKKRVDVNRNKCYISSLIADTRLVVINGILFRDLVRILVRKSYKS